MTGDVRLVNGSKMAGRLEVCFNGVWGTVCRFGWTAQAATVVCKQLGFNNSGVTIIIYICQQYSHRYISRLQDNQCRAYYIKGTHDEWV